MRLSAQTKLGHYEVLGPLGAGGMGEVYRARDLQLDREVAVKVMPENLAERADARERFEREAKAIASLSHTNILTIFEFGAEGDIHYAVTELLKGETLRDRISRADGAMETAEILRIGEAITEGLAAAHGKGIIHRDIKPENIFLTNDGGVKILDFGLARSNKIGVGDVVPDGTVPLVTQPGVMLGTVGYMSPEQARGQEATAACDVFSLGCVIYEMLSGKGPFSRDNPTDSIAAILTQEPGRIVSSTDATSRNLETLVGRALVKDPGARIADGAALRDELRALRQEANPAGGAARPFYRQPALMFGVTAVVAVLGFALFQSQSRQSKERWARETAIPEILDHIEKENFRVAFDLATEIEAVIPNDPMLAEAWSQMSNPMTFHTVPAGATVSYAAYESPDAEMRVIGQTPLDGTPIPMGTYRWRIEKTGYESLDFSGKVPWVPNMEQVLSEGFFRGVASPLTYDFTLRKVDDKSVPPGMLDLPGGRFRIALTGLLPTGSYEVPQFFLAEHETTNLEYREFVRAGGYERPEYWKYAFEKDDKEISFDEAMTEFKDRTGRAGPATWEVGDFGEEQAGHPIGGISWYEAAAYAEFRRMSLPTVYHWVRSAMPSLEIMDPQAPSIVSLSNFKSQGTRPVGESKAITLSGAVDMAGNVREWCLNRQGDNYYILGGGWEDEAYVFSQGVTMSPWARGPGNGVRLAHYNEEPSRQLVAALPAPDTDFYAQSKKVTDRELEIYLAPWQIERGPIGGEVVEREEVEGLGINEKVLIDVPYGDDKLILRIRLPEGVVPPYQSVVYFGGLNILAERKFDDRFGAAPFRKSGRAIVYLQPPRGPM